MSNNLSFRLLILLSFDNELAMSFSLFSIFFFSYCFICFPWNKQHLFVHFFQMSLNWFFICLFNCILFLIWFIFIVFYLTSQLVDFICDCFYFYFICFLMNELFYLFFFIIDLVFLMWTRLHNSELIPRSLDESTEIFLPS